jgi:hypothetical protein
VGGVSLDRLDQVRQQVGPSLELHGDVAPRLVDAHIEGDESVVGGPEVDADDDGEQHDDTDDDEDFHTGNYRGGAFSYRPLHLCSGRTRGSRFATHHSVAGLLRATGAADAEQAFLNLVRDGVTT